MPLRLLLSLPLIVILSACGGPDSPEGADAQGHSAPTEATRRANQAAGKKLPFKDARDFELARRGLIASDPDLRVEGPDGDLIWDMPGFGFIGEDTPDSVHPSLWRQARLNNIHGLFEVTPGIYQLRGYDLSNLTIIEGKSGWILVDPLTARETAAKAMAFARKHLGNKKVRAVIFTHSHIDHFGGVLGAVDRADLEAGRVQVIVPDGFMEEATSENVLAGVAMTRRSMYMYGKRLARSARGHVDTGLGKHPPYGSPGLAPPTDIVDRTGQQMIIDGVKFVFQNAPGSEAPAELTFYLPEKKAFCGAEVVSRNMHNLYTLRGAKVRDALKWAHYIDEMIDLYGEAEVYFASHHWPIWGQRDIVRFLETQRDTYKYIHDQTLRLALAGATPREIAEQLELPETLRNTWSSRGYYGTLKHNSKAVYQYYFGWYDGNPANLDSLPPVEAGAKYVELAGGADAMLAKARAAYEKGEYRWVAEMLNHLVFADPDHFEAKSLLAQAYDQLGYQSESGPWRDVYLSGAYELRHGGPEQGFNLASARDLITYTPMPSFLEAMAARLNGPEAEGMNMRINLVITDLKENYLLSLKNSVMNFRALKVPAPDADATLKMTHGLYLKLAIGEAGLRDTLFSDELDVDGSRIDLMRFFSLFEKPTGDFNIVTP